MSASLVGSEMCIRDSQSALHSTSQRPHPSQCAAQTQPSTAPPIQRGEAVSYTHLTLPTICSV
eukprot:7140086-Alexandrium_andersonii.AAC.1